MHEVLVNRLGGLSLPRKSVVRLTDRPDMTLDVYRGRKTTIQQTENTANPFYNDIRYDSKTPYNVNSVFTKINGSCSFSMTVPCYSLGKHTFWIFV